jgi:MFS family permease
MKSRTIVILSLLIGLLSGAGLAALVYYEPPTSLLRALALALIVLTVAGLIGPVLGVILRKIMPKADAGRMTMMGLRFGLWLGIFIASLVLLKMLHFMDSVLILAILALLMMIEMFLQQNAARKNPSRKSRR